MSVHFVGLYLHSSPSLSLPNCMMTYASYVAVKRL